ncbi:hypothetical protein PV326_006203 [Microctonus aethiopoides]|nr:hypothetical protein PV326_006203 [Microctonus aethiopoides]
MEKGPNECISARETERTSPIILWQVSRCLNSDKYQGKLIIENMTTIKCLADDERFALMKFRHSVQSILQSHHDDHFLLRWLRARKWDPVAAEKMLRDSLEWRKLWEVDKLADWKEPQVIKENLPHGICGYDVDGAPVVVVPFAGLDLYGILHCTPRRDMIKATVKVLERYLSVCQEQAQRCGPAAGQVVVIFDMQDFNLRQYMWRPAGEVVITLIQMYEANYPEILKTCFIINGKYKDPGKDIGVKICQNQLHTPYPKYSGPRLCLGHIFRI